MFSALVLATALTAAALSPADENSAQACADTRCRTGANVGAVTLLQTTIGMTPGLTGKVDDDIDDNRPMVAEHVDRLRASAAELESAFLEKNVASIRPLYSPDLRHATEETAVALLQTSLDLSSSFDDAAVVDDEAGSAAVRVERLRAGIVDLEATFTETRQSTLGVVKPEIGLEHNAALPPKLSLLSESTSPMERVPVDGTDLFPILSHDTILAPEATNATVSFMLATSITSLASGLASVAAEQSHTVVSIIISICVMSLACAGLFLCLLRLDGSRNRSGFGKSKILPPGPTQSKEVLLNTAPLEMSSPFVVASAPSAPRSAAQPFVLAKQVVPKAPPFGTFSELKKGESVNYCIEIAALLEMSAGRSSGTEIQSYAGYPLMYLRVSRSAATRTIAIADSPEAQPEAVITPLLDPWLEKPAEILGEQGRPYGSIERGYRPGCFNVYHDGVTVLALKPPEQRKAGSRTILEAYHGNGLLGSSEHLAVTVHVLATGAGGVPCVVVNVHEETQSLLALICSLMAVIGTPELLCEVEMCARMSIGGSTASLNPRIDMSVADMVKDSPFFQGFMATK